MKKIMILISSILYASIVSAYDFSLVCESGQTLYYNITSSTEPYTVEVTSENASEPYYTTYPSGNLVIPSAVTYNGTTYSVVCIGTNAFKGCIGLTSIVIPNSVTQINCAFNGCSGLVEMTIPFVGSGTIPTASAYTLFGYIFGETSYTGSVGVRQKYKNDEYINGNAITYTKIYYIPSGLRSVTVTGGDLMYGAFYGCSMLTSIRIEDSVSNIGNYTLYACSELEEITIRSLSGGYNYLFGGSAGSSGLPSNLKRFFVTSGILPENAFDYFSMLTSVTIGNSVTSIGNKAFKGCTGLTTLNFNAENCSGSISSYMFESNNVLSKITIGENVTKIPNKAFVNCISLDSIIIAAENPPTIYGSTFDSNLSLNTPVIVPCGIVENYEDADFWYNFRHIQQSPDCGVSYTINAISANPSRGSVTGSGTYPAGSTITLTANANDGYQFASWNDDNTDNPRTITVTEDATFIASFEVISSVPTFTITAISANPSQGIVTGGGTYPEGSIVTLTATANDGYQFTSWSDENTDNPRQIMVTGNAVYIASFEDTTPIQTFTISVFSANPNQGTVTGGGTYPEGSIVTLTATANNGFQFSSWSDNNTDNPRQITVTEDAVYVASFIPATSIDESAVSEIALFPNPINDILNITSSETISEIEIVNVMGQVVKRIEVNSDNAVCNVEDLKAGVYIVRIHGMNTESVICQRKFVKK